MREVTRVVEHHEPGVRVARERRGALLASPRLRAVLVGSTEHEQLRHALGVMKHHQLQRGLAVRVLRPGPRLSIAMTWNRVASTGT